MRVTSQIEEARKLHTESIEKMEEWDAKLQALPDDAEEKELEFVRSCFDASKAEARRHSETIERLEAILEARKAIPHVSEATDDKIQTSANAGQVKVLKEPLVYERFNNNSWIRDMYDAERGDPEAARRLDQHRKQIAVEKRDLSTAAGAGGQFVAPLWLMDEWVRLLRPGRPLANAIRRRPLPPNANAVNLPTLATGAATAVQASENASVQETDPTTSSVSADVVTIAGQVDMSRQLYERSDPGFDEIVFEELARDYANKQEVQVLYGTAANGQARGIINVSSIETVTYTDSSPTLPEMWPKLVDAVTRVSSNNLTPSLIVMHPRRWGWMLSALDEVKRPFVAAEAPQNAFARFDRVAPENLVGQLLGLPVMTNSNIRTTQGTGTNQDEIFVLATDELFLYEEDQPRRRTFEDIGSGTLTVRLQVYGYMAFLGARYPKAIAMISGTGLTAPTF
jgi:HK97 family phage major capsid protein